MTLTSCYTTRYSVGKGAKGKNGYTEKNHFLIYGLVHLETADTQKMANGAKDYDIKTEQTFIDGLIRGITLGIYTPTTTTVIK